MPRAAAFTSGVLEELLRQLEYAPRETHLRQMDAAEQLLDDLQPDRLYPEDFITYRITGYRSDLPGHRTSVVGEALQRDLVTFIQSLSWTVDLPRRQPRGTAINLDDLASRLGVSRRTLQRCRGDGLVLHYVRQEDGQRRLACYPDALDRYLSHSAARIASAAGFSRITPEQRDLIIGRAKASAADGVSLNETARRIAVDIGRSHEAIRRVLRAEDRSSGQPIFQEHGPLTIRDAVLIERARDRDVSMARLAIRFNKSVSALHRSLLRSRRSRLSTLPLVWRDGDGAASSFDGLPGVCVDLPHHACLDESILLSADTRREPDAVRVGIDCRAWGMLCSDAAKGIAVLQDGVTVEQVDMVETLLRHAAMLHLRMVLECLPALLDRVEGHVRSSISGLPPRERAAVLQLVVDLIDQAVVEQGIDGGESIPGKAIDSLERTLERGGIPVRPRRATGRYLDASSGLLAMLRECIPWSWLVPSSGRYQRLADLDPALRSLHVERYGFEGDAPRTLEAMAIRAGSTPSAIERRISRN